MHKKSILFGVVLFLLEGVASADQCQWNSKTEANDAFKILSKEKYVYLFCKPCRETQVRKVKLNSIFIEQQLQSYHAIVINPNQGSKEEVLDLAYTYVQTGKNTLTNLAGMVGCGAVEVDPFMPKRIHSDSEF